MLVSKTRWPLCLWPAALLLAGSLPAQYRWEYRDLARTRAGLAYDAARGRMVLFGGDILAPYAAPVDDTWEWAGTAWSPRSPATTPPVLMGQGSPLLYDPVRSRILYWSLGQTPWEWDGTDWTSAGAWQPVSVASAAYDTARGTIVVYDGRATWEGDGRSFALKTTSGPPQRQYPVLAYDAARRVTILFGGMDASYNGLNDTWEWNGSAWARVLATPPGPRYRHAMAYDSGRARLVLFGGTPALGDTWEYDGTSWTQKQPVLPPAPRSDAAMAYDPTSGRILLVGGRDRSGTALSDTWEWDGQAWTQRPSARPPVQQSPSHSVVYDTVQQRTLHFALEQGSEVWSWDGSSWAKSAPPGGPAYMAGFGTAYDSARGVALLFGGRDNRTQVISDDSWEWNGAWRKLAPASKPGARTGCAMAFDSTRNRILLFGGSSGTSSFQDTWEYDDATLTWNRLSAGGAGAPPARAGHAMAYDPSRLRMVMFGGGLSDTWEWDGNAMRWSAVTPAQSPPARSNHAMAHFVARGHTIVHGGQAGFSVFSDTWAWDGTSWTKLAVDGYLQSYPGGRYGHGMAYDTARSRLVLFGGWAQDQTWELTYAQAAKFTTYGAGCPGTGGVVPVHAGSGLPILGRFMAWSLSSARANQPCVLYVGASNTSWSGNALPLSLAPYGMGTCFLRQSVDLQIGRTTDAGGAASVGLVVPNNPVWIGSHAYTEWAILDPGAATPTPVVHSNALDTRFGG